MKGLLSTPALRRMGHVAWIYAGALLCGFAAERLGAPLPWMIGSMLFATALRLGGRAVNVPARTRQIGQVIVASSVGLAFTPDAVAVLASLFLPMIGAALLTIAFGFLVALVMMIIARVDVVTATLASVPTGPVESAVLAQRYGITPGPIVFSQTLRIMALVLVIPPAIVALDGGVRDSSEVLRNVEWTASGALFLLLAGVAGAALMRVTRLANPYFVGALGGAAIAAALSLPITAYPYPALVIAQTFLGTWLGAAFDRDLIVKAGAFAPAALIGTVLLGVLCALLGLALSVWTGQPWPVMILATAPGSATEMALTAKVLDEGLAVVTAFHLVRVFIIMPSADLIIGMTARLAGRKVADNRER